MNIPHLEQQLVAKKAHLARMLEAGVCINELKEISAAFEEVAVAERSLAAAKGEEHAVPYDIGWVPEAAVSEPVLLQTEYSVFLTFSAFSHSLHGGRADVGYGIVEFDSCSLTMFGYPNDEAITGHPLYEKGLRAYGIYEVRNSSWVKLKTEQNRIAFPNTPDSTQRHFIFTFHDSSFECIASGLRATLSTKPYSEIFEDVRRRVFKHDDN